MPSPRPTHRLLNQRTGAASSSAIRDLLDQARRPGMISLAGGLPDARRFPVAEVADIARAVILADGPKVLQYGVTQGEESARAALVTLFGATTSGAATVVEADGLVVTTGSQQGLDLLCRVLLDPGDVVITGDPEYLGILQVLQGHGASPHPLPIDADGLDTEALAQALAAGLRPKACYVVPHFHNPTGASISTDRRRQLHELSSRYGFVVIEDDPYRELYYEGSAPVEVSADPELTVRLRSTSKLLTPGLRIGALSGPAWLTDAVIVAKQSADLHTSTVTQAIVAAALEADWLEDHVDGLRTAYRAKRDVLTAAMDAAFGSSLRYTAPRGGMFVWADVGIDANRWLRRGLEAGVCFVPGSAFAVQRNLTNHARFSFVTASEQDLREAVGRLVQSRDEPS